MPCVDSVVSFEMRRCVLKFGNFHHIVVVVFFSFYYFSYFFPAIFIIFSKCTHRLGVHKCLFARNAQNVYTRHSSSCFFYSSSSFITHLFLKRVQHSTVFVGYFRRPFQFQSWSFFLCAHFCFLFSHSSKSWQYAWCVKTTDFCQRPNRGIAFRSLFQQETISIQIHHFINSFIRHSQLLLAFRPQSCSEVAFGHNCIRCDICGFGRFTLSLETIASNL